MPLSAPELASLRRETEDWFDLTCDISRETQVDDPYGGRGDSSPTTVASDIACAIESGIAHEQELSFAGKFADVQLFTVTLPAETDIRQHDNLQITSLVAGTGEYAEVTTAQGGNRDLKFTNSVVGVVGNGRTVSYNTWQSAVLLVLRVSGNPFDNTSFVVDLVTIDGQNSTQAVTT